MIVCQLFCLLSIHSNVLTSDFPDNLWEWEFEVNQSSNCLGWLEPTGNNNKVGRKDGGEGRWQQSNHKIYANSPPTEEAKTVQAQAGAQGAWHWQTSDCVLRERFNQQINYFLKSAKFLNLNLYRLRFLNNCNNCNFSLCTCKPRTSREDKAKFEFTWNGMEIGSIDRSQFLINFAVWMTKIHPGKPKLWIFECWYFTII